MQITDDQTLNALEAKMSYVASLIANELYFAISKSGSSLIEPMLYSVSKTGGKKLRPFLFLEWSNILSIDNAALVKVAAAIECVHAYSLIHDDMPCMDNDVYRRGFPSVHKKFGEYTALLAGNALLTLAFEIISQCESLAHDTRLKIICMLTKSIGFEGMLEGQSLDLQGFTSADGIKKIHALKTAALIRFACVSPGIIAGVATPVMQKIEEFGQNFGMLFQLADDISDAEKSDNLNITKSMKKFELLKLIDEYSKKAFVSLNSFNANRVSLLKLLTTLIVHARGVQAVVI